MVSNDLFGGFDPTLVAQIQAGNARHRAKQQKARAVKTENRHAVRRAKCASLAGHSRRVLALLRGVHRGGVL